MIQPKKNKSKSIATRKDSLDVYNNSRIVENFYRKNNYTPTPSERLSESATILNEDANNKIVRDKKLPKTVNSKGRIEYNEDRTKPKTITPNQYRKKIDNNKYLQRETANGFVNLEAPMQLFDKRIEPVIQKGFFKGVDAVSIPTYNNIATKPFDLLTDNEKKERLKIYGTSGIPESYSGVKSKQVISSPTINNKPNPKVTSVNKLTPNDLVKDNNINSNSKIIPKARKPKYYEITEKTIAPYGLTDSDNGIDTTTYEVEDGNNISDKEIKNRTITPKYANGGIIDPPIKSKGLSPEQQAEAEADVLFTNNWNANRVVGGVKLPKGYQISPNQPVTLSNLNLDKKEGEGLDRGSYNHETGEILLDPSFQEEYGIPAHEYAHRFQDKTKLMRPKLYNDYIKKPIETLAPNTETYQSDPNEIHSELMRLRRNANFKPDQVIVPEDVQNVDFNNYNFNAIKDKDTLIKLLNTTADASIPNTISYAAYGGNINNNNINTMNRINRLPKNKRHIAPSALLGGASAVSSMIPGVGTAVGAGLGLVSGLLSKGEQEQALKEQQQKALYSQGQQLTAQDNMIDKQALLNYDINGQTLYDPTRNLGTFSKGGSLTSPSFKGKYLATGGDLTSLNSRTEVAEGNTHGEKTIDGEYGITLSNGIEPVAEIEDQEVLVDNDKVYSDRLMYDKTSSYADKAKQIAKKAGRLETKLNNTTDTKSRNGYERALAGTKMAEEALFAHQEETKLNEGMQEIENLPTTAVMANGGEIDPPNNNLLKKGIDFIIDQNSLIGLVNSYDNNSRYKTQDFIGLLPGGVATLADQTLEIADKERSNIHKFKFNQNKGKKLQPKSLPINIKVKDSYASGGRLPLDGTEGTISNADFAKSIGMFTPKSIDNNYGSDPSFIEQIAPSLIDNVGNYLINQNTPSLPKPIYNNAPALETNVNVNPQLSAINNTVGSVTNSILGNTNNSNTARANITSAKLKGLQSKLGVLGEQENLERGLRNQDVMQRSQVNASNNAMSDQYNMNNFIRTNDIQSRTSANLGNLSEDIDRTLNRRDQDQYYNNILLADILDDPTGEKIRTANRNPELFKSAKLRQGISREAKRKALRTPYNYNNIIQSAL